MEQLALPPALQPSTHIHRRPSGHCTGHHRSAQPILQGPQFRCGPGAASGGRMDLAAWPRVGNASAPVAVLVSVVVPRAFTFRMKYRRSCCRKRFDERRSVRGLCVALPDYRVARFGPDSVDCQCAGGDFIPRTGFSDNELPNEPGSSHVRLGKCPIRRMRLTTVGSPRFQDSMQKRVSCACARHFDWPEPGGRCDAGRGDRAVGRGNRANLDCTACVPVRNSSRQRMDAHDPA